MPSLLYRDIRSLSQLGGELNWIISVDPNGNTLESRKTTLSWSGSALKQVFDATWTLREGIGSGGDVLIDDMRATTSLDVEGTSVTHLTVSVVLPVALEENVLPSEFQLDANYPNPFNPYTEIRYNTPETSHVTIRVFNVQGQLVKTLVDEITEPGRHSVRWDGQNMAGLPVSSGVYLYRMTSGTFHDVQSMVLLK
jgi:hypothetical protein